MAKRFGMTTLVLILLFVFAFSVNGTLAAWQANGATINKITIGSVKGKITEVYQQGQTVFPGDTVDKVVGVKNTGTIDSVVRVKVEKAWGESRGSDGILVVDQTLSTDNIQITFDTVNWYYDESDGYFYYKHVLKPGETTVTPLFKEFHLDSDTDKSFENMQADIKISMECIQAGGNAISFWGQDLQNLGIVYNRPETPSTNTSVTFVDPQNAFRFKGAEDGDLFANFKNLIPGETVSQVISITNEYQKKTAIYFYAAITDQPHATDETRDLIDKLLKEYAVIVITDSTGKEIYKGPVWGNLDETGNASTLKNRILLGEFLPGETRDFHVSISIDPRMDNQYQSLLGLVKWVFSANGIETDVIDNPGTETAFSLGIYLVLMVISGGALLLLGFFKLKKRKTAE